MSGWTKAEVLKRNGVDDNGTARDGAIAVRFRWLEQQLEDIKAERDALRADAERYRWLKGLPNRCDFIEGVGHCIAFDVDFEVLGKYGINCSDDLDAAIDAARSLADEGKHG